MSIFRLLIGTKITNDEEYRNQIKKTNKYLWVLILLGIFSIVLAYYIQFSGKITINFVMRYYVLGIYYGVGIGLIIAAIILFIHNRRLLRNDAKLKEARLTLTDERNIEIGTIAVKRAALVTLIAMYVTALICGLFFPIIYLIMLFIINLFMITYGISYMILNEKM